MELTNKIYEKKDDKWILSKIEKTLFTLIRFKLNFHFVVGIGYFTAYEDENILVKTSMMPFISMTEVYRKTKSEIVV